MAKRKQSDTHSATSSQSPQRSTAAIKRGKGSAPTEPTTERTGEKEKTRPTRAKNTAAGPSRVQSKVKPIISKGLNSVSNTKSKQTNTKSNTNSNNDNNNNNNTSTKKLANTGSNSNKTNRSDDNDCPPTRPSRPTGSNQQQKRLKDNCGNLDSSSLTASSSTATSSKTQTKTLKPRTDKSDNTCKVQSRSAPKTAKIKSKSTPKTRISEQIIESFSNDSNKSDELFGELIQQQMEGMDEDTKRIQEAEAALRSLTGDIDVNAEETDTEDVEEADKPMFENLFAKKESEKSDKDNKDCAANAWKDMVTLSASSSSCGSMSETSPQHSPPVTPDDADHIINSPAESRASVSTINESTDQTIEDTNNHHNEDDIAEGDNRRNHEEVENLMKIEEHCNAFIESNRCSSMVTLEEDHHIDEESDEEDSSDTEDESAKDNREACRLKTDRNMSTGLVMSPNVAQMTHSSDEANVCQRKPEESPLIDRPFVKEEEQYPKSSCCVESSQQNRIIKAQLQQPFIPSAQSQAFGTGFKPKAPERKYFDCKYQKSMSQTMSSMSCHSPLNAYMSTKESSNETNIGICHQNLLPTSAGPQMMSTQYPEDESMTSASNLSFPGSPPNGLCHHLLEIGS